MGDGDEARGIHGDTLTDLRTRDNGRKTGSVTAHPFRRNLYAQILRERNRRATRFGAELILIF